MNVQRRDDVLSSFSEPKKEADTTIIRRAIKRQNQKLDIERRAAQANQDGSSKLLLELQRFDWQAVGSTQSKTAKHKAKGQQARRQKDVVGGNPSILLISMGCGALGLNLTAASTVVLMDPWWQSTIEQQAIDRVHRIGQTRDISGYE